PASATALLTVAPRAITVTADAKSKTYGDADPALTYQITSGSLVGSDSFTGGLTRSAGENVGSHAITEGTLALSSNYTLTYLGANLTIAARAITVTADAKSKTHGDADPALTYQITSGSLVTGDSFAGGLTRVAGENVGSYAITQGTLALSNYTLSYVGANLTIGKATLTVTADDKSRPYGDANPAFTAIITGFKNGEMLVGSGVTGSPSLTSTAIATSPVAGSPYTITAALGTLASANYSFTFANGKLTVTKVTLTVTADDKSREYGNANPAFTATITGFKNGETLASSGVTGSPSLTTGADQYSSVAGSPFTI